MIFLFILWYLVEYECYLEEQKNWTLNYLNLKFLEEWEEESSLYFASILCKLN